MHSQRRQRSRWRDPSLLMMVGLLVVAMAVAYVVHGVAGVARGAEGGWDLLVRAAPMILLGIGLAGMLQVLVPPGTVGKWMGDEAGLLGITVGMFAGMLSPGGPYVTFPIAAALLNSGAGIGPLAGFVSAHNLGAVNRFFVWDIPFLGAPFSFARLFATLLMPVAHAVLVPIVYWLLPSGPPRTAAAPGRARREEES